MFPDMQSRQPPFSQKSLAATTTTLLLFLPLLLLAAAFIISCFFIHPSKFSVDFSSPVNKTVINSHNNQNPPEETAIPLNCTIKNQTFCSKTQNNTPPSEEPECPDYFRWIHEDLRPWNVTGITKDMVERAKRTAHFRLVIVNGKAYVEKYRKSIQTRDLFTIWGILQLLRKYPGNLPDLELMFDCDDRPVVKPAVHRGDNVTVAGPPPLFRYCGNKLTVDIVFPDWSFWGWAEINIKPWESVLREIKEGNNRIKWMDREPYAYWKGNPSVAETRKDLFKCNVSNTQDWNARLYVQDWILEGQQGFRQSDLANQPLHDNEANTENMFVEYDREMEDIPDKIFNNDIENVQNQLVTTLDKGKSCQLALGTIGNIVASGIVFESMNKNATIHGVPLASTDVRVAIEVPIKRDAVLPRPIDDELVFLHQAVGTHVAWPKRLVVLVDKEGDKQMPTRVASILKYADRVMENNIGLEIKLEADFIAKTSGKTYLMKSDILELCKMQKIGAAVIICYMRLLYDKIKVNKLNLGLKFCNPEDSGRNLGNRARALAERFQMLRPKQLGIFPYNKRAIMIFHTAIGKSTRKTIGWEKMDCPRQPSNFECGYYVMRYMKDIIENKNASISNKFSKKSSYSKEEIDEVREELAEYIWSKCI